jgi:hypothetical protein
VQCDARAPEASQVWQNGDEFAGKNIMYRVSRWISLKETSNRYWNCWLSNLCLWFHPSNDLWLIGWPSAA